jgi:hypothetical protein
VLAAVVHNAPLAEAIPYRLAWGLLETATTPLQIPDNECENLEEAFDTLIGGGVPREQVCG